jgi:hypothetical protein
MACLNCGRKFSSPDKYCPACGQHTSTTRMNTREALHQFSHAFTHTDRGFFYLFPKLLSRPGIIAREYNQGRRKTYFSPFTFLLLILAISSLLVAYFNFMSIGIIVDRPGPEQQIYEFINKHFNIPVLIGIPFTAYLISILFKQQFNFAEGLVLVCYTSGIRSAFFCLLIIPLGVLFKEQWYMIVYTYVLLFMLYLSWACCQYLNDYRLKNWVKASLAVFLTQIAIAIFVAAAITIAYLLR